MIVARRLIIFLALIVPFLTSYDADARRGIRQIKRFEIAEAYNRTLSIDERVLTFNYGTDDLSARRLFGTLLSPRLFDRIASPTSLKTGQSSSAKENVWSSYVFGGRRTLNNILQNFQSSRPPPAGREDPKFRDTVLELSRALQLIDKDQRQALDFLTLFERVQRSSEDSSNQQNSDPKKDTQNDPKRYEINCEPQFTSLAPNRAIIDCWISDRVDYDLRFENTSP